MKLHTIVGVGAMAVTLAGCIETTDTYAPTSMRTGSAVDENACLSAVAAETKNTVTILSSEFSQANTIVMVGVGDQRAPWKCLVSNGRVAEVMFAGSEGYL